MAKKLFGLAFFILFVSTTSFATNAKSRCATCEVIVELDAAHAERFASAVQIISSMPLQGTVIDPGSATSLAKVLVATWPNWEGGNSFDVANKVLAFTEQSAYGINTITAVWNAHATSEQPAQQ